MQRQIKCRERILFLLFRFLPSAVSRQKIMDLPEEIEADIFRFFSYGWKDSVIKSLLVRKYGVTVSIGALQEKRLAYEKAKQ